MRRRWSFVIIVAAGLMLAACGNGSGVGSTPTSPTPSPTWHVAQSGEPALVQVAGYDYADPKGKAGNACDVMMGVFSDNIFTNCSIHYVTGGQGRMFIIQLGISDSMLGEAMRTDFARSMLSSMAGYGLASVRHVDGVEVAQATLPRHQGSMYAWMNGNVMTLLQVKRTADGYPYLDEYMKASH